MKESKHLNFLRESLKESLEKYDDMIKKLNKEIDNLDNILSSVIKNKEIELLEHEESCVPILSNLPSDEMESRIIIRDKIRDIIKMRYIGLLTEFEGIIINHTILRKTGSDLLQSFTGYITFLEHEIENLEKIDDLAKEKIEKMTETLQSERNRRKVELESKKLGDEMEKLDEERIPRQQKLRELRSKTNP